MVLFLLSGRWNLGRVTSIDGSAFTAPRLWLVGGVLFFALLPIVRPRRDVLPPVGLLLFLGYFLLTTTWAPDAHLALQKSIDLLVMALGILGLRRLTAHVGVVTTTRCLWSVVGVVFGVFAVFGLVSAALSGGGRLAVLGGGPNVYGRNMGVLFVVSLAAMLDRGRPGGWPLAGVVVAGLLVALTGSRGALLGTVTGVAGLLFVRRIQPGRTLVALLLSSLGMVAMVRWTALGRDAMAAFQHRVIVLTFEQSYDSGRGHLHDAAFEMIARSPWLGEGLNAFRARGHGVYPHNLELEALTDGGIVGLCVLAAALAVPVLALVIRSAKLDPVTAAVFLLHLSSAQVSGDFYDSRGVFLFAMLLVLQWMQRARPRARLPLQVVRDPYRWPAED